MDPVMRERERERGAVKTAESTLISRAREGANNGGQKSSDIFFFSSRKTVNELQFLCLLEHLSSVEPLIEAECSRGGCDGLEAEAGMSDPRAETSQMRRAF